MDKAVFRSAALVASVLVIGGTGYSPQVGAAPPTVVTSPAAPVPDMTRYVDSVNGWSISYPTGWRLDSSDPAFVRISDPDQQSLVGIHVAPAKSPLPVAVDKILASQEQYRQQKGQTWAVVSRQPMSLGDGTPAVDVLVEMGPGGRARELYAVKSGKVFGIDAETYVTSWDRYSPDFDRILNSFALPA